MIEIIQTDARICDASSTEFQVLSCAHLRNVVHDTRCDAGQKVEKSGGPINAYSGVVAATDCDLDGFDPQDQISREYHVVLNYIK